MQWKCTNLRTKILKDVVECMAMAMELSRAETEIHIVQGRAEELRLKYENLL